MAEYPPEVKQRFHGTPEQMTVAFVGERPTKSQPVIITDYDPGWPDRYAAAGSALRQALGDRIVGIEHVGSTSVPGLPAKPIIDIDLLLDDTADESRYVPALEALGYWLLLREPWWYGHRMLVSAAEDVNLHVWPRDAAEPIRHRLFRDWLRSHSADRELYASAKRRIAVQTADRPDDYSLTKSDVIDEIFTRVFEAGS